MAVVREVQQLDVATVRAQVGAHRLQGSLDPGPDLVRVQAVHQQQAGHQVVGDQCVLHRGGQHACALEDLEHTGQTGAVQGGDLPDQLLGALPRHDAGRGAGVEQLLDPLPGPPQGVGGGAA